MPELDKGWMRSVLRVTGDMRLRKKVGIDLKKRARDFKHLERERERVLPCLDAIVAFHC